MVKDLVWSLLCLGFDHWPWPGNFCKLQSWPKKKKKKVEFPLWCNEIGGVLGALGHRFNLQPYTVDSGSGIAMAAAWVATVVEI